MRTCFNRLILINMHMYRNTILYILYNICQFLRFASLFSEKWISLSTWRVEKRNVSAAVAPKAPPPGPCHDTTRVLGRIHFEKKLHACAFTGWIYHYRKHVKLGTGGTSAGTDEPRHKSHAPPPEQAQCESEPMFRFLLSISIILGWQLPRCSISSIA